MGIEKIRPMADEVASLMAARFGGVKRGHAPELQAMLRKRGGALPRRLRRQAQMMVQAERMSGQPKLARQVDLERLERAHKALTAYLRPLGQSDRLRGGTVSVAASILFGLMLLAAIILWLVRARGLI
ncbi:MAG: hypothetical protein QM682_09275 [Paracoccus sp. (in: a-proteobacteria)]|uniref:hypothetical protein n=1 Tax=Paracoccus sp. TaxID=267 RepID=UPI0039E3812E